MLTFDFETEGIVGNPIFNPPRPVGVSIKRDNQESRYWAWGHPTGNNCTWEVGRSELLAALRSDPDWLAHNRAFEEAILRKWFGVSKRNTLRFHDTQFIVFLLDPYAYSFGLKPSSERYLDLPSDEQQELKEWILANVREAKESDWGAYICRAPGDLVGKYAGDSGRTGAPGDTDRTFALYEYGIEKIREGDMEGAYRRELELCPILSASSLHGCRVDREGLSRDIPIYRAAQKLCAEYIYSRLGVFELSKDAQLAEALARADQVTEWVLTPTGKRSVSRKNLAGRVKDPQLMECLAYHGIIDTCLGTFAEPWLEQSRQDGRLHAQWNQVRGERGADGDITGTRTGRLSCKAPNLTNIPNNFEDLIVPAVVLRMFEELNLGHWTVLEGAKVWVGLPLVPHMRRYMLPEQGHVWLKRDFSAQEMRIMAHFAEGKLYDAFHEDPSTDPHDAVRQIILENAGINLPRKFVKITGFGIMYGRGIPNLSAALGVSTDEGKRTRDAYFSALPEVRVLSRETSSRGRRGLAIRTWGGRLYYREPSTDRDLSYKLLNYLIQGSAADQTKQSIIDWNRTKQPCDFLMAAVHDELDISAPEEDADRAMRVLREAMDAPRFDVPFQSEGFKGFNWDEIYESE